MLLLSSTIGIAGAKSIGVIPEFSDDSAGFTVRVNEDLVAYRIMSLFVRPGEMVKFEALIEGEPFICMTEQGLLRPRGLGKWDWRAPRGSGIYRVRIIRSNTMEGMLLNVFVERPLAELTNNEMNGYRIGQYPAYPYRGLDVYRRPKGLVEVTEEMVEIQVSPHFKLGQFLCKQEGGWPKYVVLRERLLLKLERVIEMLAAEGHEYSTLNVMSGYRTPWYNRIIGNGRYSRHTYGDAADVYPDQYPEDGRIDDLNRDGVANVRDAIWLYDLIEGVVDEPWYVPFVGGLGRYGSNGGHGPFVHVDARGFRARW